MRHGGFTGVISRTVNLQWTTIDDRFNAPSLENLRRLRAGEPLR